MKQPQFAGTMATFNMVSMFSGMRNCEFVLGVEMSSVNRGWKVSAGNLLPIMTDLQPSPQKFLEVVRCGYKSFCDTMRSSCRKHGVTCSTACYECRGVCGNTSNDIDSESDEDNYSVLE